MNNVGSTDKIIRIVLAVIIGGLGFYFNTWWGLLGLIPFFTAVFGFCPIYSVFGASTCKTRNKAE